MIMRSAIVLHGWGADGYHIIITISAIIIDTICIDSSNIIICVYLIAAF